MQSGGHRRLTGPSPQYILCILAMHSDLAISHADPRPMYLQIMEQIRQRVAIGDWPVGHELPSIRTLAVATQVSVITVKRAYLELERDGLIVTRQGKGSYVSDNVALASESRRRELAEHLASAAVIGRQLGLRIEQVVAAMRDAMHNAERGR
jgi:GntR family transcriptional regulator